MIGLVLKEARLNKCLSQQKVADFVGVTKQTYLKWEGNYTQPKASIVYKLSQILDITCEEICSGKLYKRYSLEDFIYKSAKLSRESEILSLWKSIPDHEEFFSQLNRK